MLGEMLLELKLPEEALKEFEATLTKEPNRFWHYTVPRRQPRLPAIVRQRTHVSGNCSK